MRARFRLKSLLSACHQATVIFGLGCALLADAQDNPNTGATNQTASPSPSARSVDQGHVMADVGYHFANLWFAAENRNWPLAQYYLGQTRSHLEWAVSLHPVRKLSTGAEVDLKGIFDAINNSFLSEVGKSIEAKDTHKFKTAYEQTLAGCYACHAACEKPFLRLQIPTAPAASIINFVDSSTTNAAQNAKR